MEPDGVRECKQEKKERKAEEMSDFANEIILSWNFLPITLSNSVFVWCVTFHWYISDSDYHKAVEHDRYKHGTNHKMRIAQLLISKAVLISNLSKNQKNYVNGLLFFDRLEHDSQNSYQYNSEIFIIL